MTIKVTLKDGTGVNGDAAVTARHDLPAGVVAYVEPYRRLIGQTKAMVNSTYGADFNVNAAFGGTPENIHDGADNVYWTASVLSGTWDFNSTTITAFADAASIDAVLTVNNDEALFTDAAAGTTDTSAYGYISGAIYLATWPTTGGGTREVQLRFRLSGVDVGLPVGISNYIDTATLGSWQTFTIPIADFATGGIAINQCVLKTVHTGGGAAQNYYIDALKFEQTGGAVFSVQADVGSIYEITSLQITFVDAYVNTLTDATTPKVVYNKIINQTLTRGLVFQLTTAQVVRFNGTFSTHADFMSFPGTVVQSHGDGVNVTQTYSIPFDPPVRLNSHQKDIFELTVSEDLTGLVFARAFVRGGTEEINTTNRQY